MSRFLSTEWLEQARSNPIPEDFRGAEGALVLEQVVTGSPDGTVVYRVHAHAGRALIEWPVPDTDAAPDLRLTVDWPTAVEVAAGRLSTQKALMQGRLKLSGSPTGGADRIRELTGADPLSEELRRTTSWT
jgi:hypothetical protein